MALWCLPYEPPISGVILGPVDFKIEQGKGKRDDFVKFVIAALSSQSSTAD